MARHHESRSHERHAARKHAMHEGHYAGHDPRRRQELEDAGMIREDHNAVANLPQEVKMAYYPDAYDAMPEGLDDTIGGIDRQVGMDDSQRNRHMNPKKV